MGEGNGAPTTSRSPASLAALTALREAGIPGPELDAPQTLLEDLQEAVIAAATADPWAFDRPTMTAWWPHARTRSSQANQADDQVHAAHDREQQDDEAPGVGLERATHAVQHLTGLFAR